MSSYTSDYEALSLLMSVEEPMARIYVRKNGQAVPAGPYLLGHLADVDDAAPEDRSVLRYDDGEGRWKPGQAIDGLVHAAGALGSVLAWDSFQRPDQVGLGTADDGGTWEVSSGTAAQIIGGEVAQLSSQPFVVRDVGTANGVLEVTHLGGANDGPVIRYADPDNYLQLRQIGSAIQLRKIVAGTATTLKSESVSPTRTPGRRYRWVVRMDGDRIHATFDGFPLTHTLSADDQAAFGGNTRHGALLAHGDTRIGDFIFRR